MDGFDQTVNVKVIMATNRADTLDPALLRPGRLDRKIEFPLPDRRQKRLVFQASILAILFVIILYCVGVLCSYMLKDILHFISNSFQFVLWTLSGFCSELFGSLFSVAC